MMALLQRVTRAQVTVADAVRGRIDRGLLVFVCAEPGDGVAQAAQLVDKLLKLRIFADDAGKMNRSVQEVQGGVLIVSQFTLAADTAGGNRPSFSGAAPPALGRASVRRGNAHRARAPFSRAGGRVRCRHAGGTRQRRAGDDPAARGDVTCGPSHLLAARLSATL